MKTLLIDDQRNLKADCVARTFKDGIKQLKSSKWELLLLDHDLGCFDEKTGIEKTGYDIICWLEKNPNRLPKKIELVTSNPVGRQRMAKVIEHLYRKF
jgi:hypothetical protein